MKQIISAFIVSAALTAGIALATFSVQSSCSLTVSPATIPLGSHQNITVTWTSNGNTNITGGTTSGASLLNSNAQSGTRVIPVIGALTTNFALTTTGNQSSAICKATIFGTSNHQP